ncbi:hypothetical protein LTR91_012315 [Friedmanniomyces endolithicus]|uniref:Zn(2)-C6 fungal-type domain-containing protein n=1 Tax=Friedmanniomyces endolithicus TaxID=329885 RepID=A0AAN6KFJ3_9PEZI|nr:hypothetical protein LTR03_004442 [Friedmanniomyces endolithicus]KAK0880769.1 hypothetical protein LTR87_005430 [Friedmanniomyces endolithicus]KAK0914140.1 hypothetical protein LTR02_001873 [Friedmanniomyces endolithicus]KAK0920668.1 hypothetical protein LTR57_009528 [Friedmanniomyces endolithicus]KAK0978139.1 hypothetical protein LTS01_012875 [Friedmanniomyces endolithicus]
MDYQRRPPYAAPPPPHAPPTAPPYAYPHPHTPHPPQPQSHQQQYAPPPPATGTALPPINPPYGPPGAAHDHRTLPSLQHPSNPHEHHVSQEHYPYSQHNRSGHATPAPVNRTYSHDSTVQRTPTTPAQPGPYPPMPGPDGSQHPPPPPLQHHMEYTTHPGYPPTNGVPHGLPPPGHPGQPPPQPHHEQYPQYAPPSMENQHGQYPPQQQQAPMYPPPGYGPMSSSASMQRKKQMRATQACEQCRTRKQKCDEGVPCSFCKEQGLHCQYRDTPPAKTDKNMEKLLNHMDAQTTGLDALTSKMDEFHARLRRMEQSNANTSAQAVAGADPEDRPKKPGEHRTAPHKLLLLWPSVQPLLNAASVTNNDGYVMEAEDRGILRLFSRGEGIDEHDGTQPGGPSSPARSEDSSNESGSVNAPTLPEGLWGTGLPQTPSSDIRRSEPYNHWGGLKPDGTLDLDSQTVRDLYASYMKHIHVMHPFLDQQRLRTMFNKFIIRHCPDQQKQRSRAAFVAHMDDDSGRAAKRQRSNGTHANPSTASDTQPPQRSPGNAVIYLVLALGKICQHKTPLPGVIPYNSLTANALVSHQLNGNHGVSSSSPVSTPSVAIKPSPISPNSTPATQPTPPVDGGSHRHARSRRSSLETGGSVSGHRNIDVIPGLAYFAKATEILGENGDGNNLVHAQMFLLAGLYKGQLARVKESMSWITMAGRAVLSLLDRYKLYNNKYWTGYGDVGKKYEQGQKRIKDKRHNMIILASWTCLQLESDILAELPLPSSRIQDVENMLLYPNKVTEDETYSGLDGTVGNHQQDDTILMFYSAQMFLRTRLNKVHRELYGSECLEMSLGEVREVLKSHESILGQWRDGLPPELKWDDDDEPPKDILSARLRAKYWGARYVVNRPFLDYALHIMPHVKDGKKVRAVAKDVHNNPRDDAEMHIFEAITTMSEGDVIQACHRCIGAAMQSTVALDGVPDRLIVTNIHGTAHAQFGNMLVLSATYYSSYLNFLVSDQKDRFQRLLSRTIKFLKRLSAISPTCAVDYAILENIQKALFHVPPEERHIYRNEGITEGMTSADGSFSAPST